MARPIHVLYIPGLGDQYDAFRRFALMSWRLWGVSTELVPSVWDDGNPLNGKIDRIIHAIKHAEERGKRVVLIGESAGGALSLIVANRQEVYKVITLCGVTQATTPISQHIRKRAPAFIEAVKKLDGLTISAPIISIRSIFDPVVGKRYSTATGAKPYVVWSIGHVFTIVLCWTLYAPYVVYLAKK